MTNYEHLMTLTEIEIADFFCHKVDLHIVNGCWEFCPFRDICYTTSDNKSGIRKWLSQEYKQDKYGF